MARRVPKPRHESRRQYHLERCAWPARADGPPGLLEKRPVRVLHEPALRLKVVEQLSLQQEEGLPPGVCQEKVWHWREEDPPRVVWLPLELTRKELH